jgi:hypothetical protein
MLMGYNTMPEVRADIAAVTGRSRGMP